MSPSNTGFDQSTLAVDDVKTMFGRGMSMNERQWELLCAVQDLIGGILSNMDADPYHAPAPWILENLWRTVEVIKGMESE